MNRETIKPCKPYPCWRNDGGPKCHATVSVSCPHSETCFAFLALQCKRPKTIEEVAAQIGLPLDELKKRVAAGELRPVVGNPEAKGATFSFLEVMRFWDTLGEDGKEDGGETEGGA